MAACNAKSSILTVLRKNRGLWPVLIRFPRRNRDTYICYTFYNLPVHVLPSPVYPALHAHTYDPTVLLQTALASQLWELVEHSSISAWESGIFVRLYLPDSLHLVAGLCIHFFFLRNNVLETVSNVSFTLHRNCTFFHTNQIFLRAIFFIFTRIGIAGLHTKLVNPLTETASF